MDNIYDATEKGDVASLRRILAANPGFPLADPKLTCFLRTPLHAAAISGYVEFASIIVDTDPKLAMVVDSQGCTPLHLACTQNNVDMVTVLLNGNTNACTVRDRNGGTPLHLAAMRNQVKIMELLIEKGPQAIHQRLLNTNETILHLCVKHNTLSAMLKLVKYFGDNRENLANIPDPISVNSVDSGGNTILHLAAQKKRTEMLRYWIRNDGTGVDINIRNNEGLTALQMLDIKEMEDIGISCYDYHTPREVPQNDTEVPQQHTEVPQQHTEVRLQEIIEIPQQYTVVPQQIEVPQQSRKSKDEWLTERMNTIMVVATLIAAIAFQAVINPPGGVFQEDSKIDSITDPVMFIYYLRRVIGNPAMAEGFRSYYSPGIIPQTASYRIDFVTSLLAAANQSASLTLRPYQKYLEPGIVLDDDSLRSVISQYNKTDFSPYLIRYAGTAILAYTSPKAYEAYIILNSLSLAVCGLTILAAIFDAVKQRPDGSTSSIVGFLEVLVATAVACIFLSYTIVITTIVPPFYMVYTISTIFLFMLVGSIFMLLAIFAFLEELSSDPDSRLLRFLGRWLRVKKDFPSPKIKVIIFVLILLSFWTYFIGWKTARKLLDSLT